MRKYHPDATIFFNSGGTNMQLEELHQFQARFEMEPLPTVWVGYGVLPVQAKYFSRTGASVAIEIPRQQTQPVPARYRGAGILRSRA